MKLEATTICCCELMVEYMAQWFCKLVLQLAAVAVVVVVARLDVLGLRLDYF